MKKLISVLLALLLLLSSCALADKAVIHSPMILDTDIAPAPSADITPVEIEQEKPLNGIIIGIDPGHQDHPNYDKERVSPYTDEMKMKVTGGTASCTTGTAEYIVVLDIGLALRDALIEQGATVYMTRESHDVDISNLERATMMNEYGCDAVLRVHLNGSTDSSVHGIGMYVKSFGDGAEESYAIGEKLLTALGESTGSVTEPIHQRDSYTGLNWSTVPCVLMELGYMSNPEEDAKLLTEEYQALLVEGIVNGMLAYFAENPKQVSEEELNEAELSEEELPELAENFDPEADDEEPEESGEEPEEVKLPLSGISIGIDPGHQDHANNEKEPVAPGSSEMKAKVSSGTAGCVTRVPEYEVVLQVAFKFKALLEEQGATVYMTRESHDVDISNVERATMMNDLGVDAVLRLHCNGYNDNTWHGIGMWVKSKGEGAEESKAIAEVVIQAMGEATGAKCENIHISDTYTGLNWSTVPCILVEMGYQSNPEEDKLLASDEYQQKLAEGMTEGLLRYFAETENESEPSEPVGE